MAKTRNTLKILSLVLAVGPMAWPMDPQQPPPQSWGMPRSPVLAPEFGVVRLSHSDSDASELDSLEGWRSPAEASSAYGSASESEAEAMDSCSDAEADAASGWASALSSNPDVSVQAGAQVRDAQGHWTIKLVVPKVLPTDASLGPLSGATLGLFDEPGTGAEVLVIVSASGRVLAQMAVPDCQFQVACRPAGSARGNAARVVFALNNQEEEGTSVYELFPDGRVREVHGGGDELESFVQGLHALADGSVIIHRAYGLSKVTPDGDYCAIARIGDGIFFVTLEDEYDSFIPVHPDLAESQGSGAASLASIEIQADGLSFRAIQSDGSGGEAVYAFPERGTPRRLASGDQPEVIAEVGRPSE